MNGLKFILIIISVLISGFKVNVHDVGKKNKITLKLHLNQNDLNYSELINLDLRSMNNAGDLSYESMQSKVVNGIAEWNVITDEPYEMVIRVRKNKYIGSLPLEPGDSIVIVEGNKDFKFSGKGTDKFELSNKIGKIKDSLIFMVSNPVRYKTNSVEDYLQWNKYLNTQLNILLPLIESYSKRISPLAYRYIKDRVVDRILDDRSDKFASFRWYASKSGMSYDSLCSIYDSTYASSLKDRALPSLTGDFFGSWAFIKFNVLRQFKFNNDSIGSELNRSMLYYDQGNKIFKGIARQKFLLEFLSEEMIHDIGFTAETDSLLELYYSEPEYPEYKLLMKEYEKKARILANGKKAPDFTLFNEDNQLVNKSKINNKVVLMDFWFTGCVGCIQMAPVIKKIEQRFVNDSNILFLSISTDKNINQWKLSNKEKKYTSGSGLKLYTGAQGNNHPMIKDYNIGSYPSLYLLDMRGNIVGNPLPDPRLDSGKQLIRLIEKQLVEGKDGPYVFGNKEQKIAYYINGDNLMYNGLNGGKQLKVSTDEYNKDFQTDLKSHLSNESSVYSMPSKLLVLSDIEGNFKAFRELLQATNVIDKDYNWIFGNGHLVFNGDMFDRGNQVTECLWLIYSLEEKAKANGGYVHFILGNHEIMNLNNDVRYAKEKYIHNSTLIPGNAEVWGAESELGKWLRTKNVVEKIGDILFVHGGISDEVIKLPLDINGLNEISRLYYDKSNVAKNSLDNTLSQVFSTKNSPFWYRLYYLESQQEVYTNGDTVYKAPMVLIDKTLEKYGVKRIITGHTIVANTITSHYNNKVINIDTRHSEGHSEALFVDGKSYYHVNNIGEKKLLFQE